MYIVVENFDKKTIVIGAGASGVAAATKLVSNGFKHMMIVETEHRFDGRVMKRLKPLWRIH